MQGSGSDPIVQATRLMNDGKLAEARRVVMRSIAEHPDSAAGLTLAGHLDVRCSSPSAAVRSFERAASADRSDDPRTLLNLARAQELAGRTTEALATAERAVGRFPENGKARAMAALLMVGNKRFDDAAALLSAGDGIAAIDPETGLRIGLRLASSEPHRPIALDLLHRAVRAPARNLEAAVRTLAVWIPGNDDRAPKAARRAAVLCPDTEDAVGAIERVYQARNFPVKRAAWAWRSYCLKPGDKSRLASVARLTHEVRWPSHGIAANTLLLRLAPSDLDIINRLCTLYARDYQLSADKAPVRTRAVAWGSSVVATEPTDPRIWDAIVGLYKDVEALREARSLWATIIARFPSFEVLHYNYGLFLDEQSFLGEAVSSLRRAQILRPGYQRACNIMSLSLARQHDLNGALGSVRRAIAINPQHAACWVNYGSHLRALGRYSEALSAYEETERLGKLSGDKEQEAAGRFNRGMTSISVGELETGFQYLEARWATKGFPSPRRNFKQPIWRGPRKHPDTGLLTYFEQGLGDEVMMSWYIPLLRRDTRRLVVDCDARLVDIYARTYEGVEFIARSKTMHPTARDPSIRHKVPILHVPQYYVPETKFLIRQNWDWAERRGERFPSRLVIREEKRRRWDHWLEERFPGRRRVALSWRSKVRNRTRDVQYVTIEELAQALPDGVVAINLQYSSEPEELEQLAELVRHRDIDVVTPEGMDLTEDLEDIFAALQVSDAVVTPMISLAWMSGAVGCPGFIFRTSRERAIWHQFGTPFVPWAPSMRLFIRDPSEPWDQVIRDIHDRLTRFLANPPARYV